MSPAVETFNNIEHLNIVFIPANKYHTVCMDHLHGVRQRGHQLLKFGHHVVQLREVQETIQSQQPEKKKVIFF